MEAGAPTAADQTSTAPPTAPRPPAPHAATSTCTPRRRYSRLAYTEALPDEKATTAIGFLARARAFLATHGITQITRLVTDNGACYRATAFSRTLAAVAHHQQIRPYTPRHNGKVERYQRILAEELLYARTWTSETQRATALKIWNLHYNYHRPHTTTGNKPPATRLHHHVTNVTSSYG